MFRSVMIAGGAATVVLAAIATINAVIALYYYAKVVKTVWLDDPLGEPADEVEPVGSLRLALGITVVLTVAIGFFPSLATFAGEAARVVASGG
jgi:NADH-quinone oxidoreductase subunit N